MVWDNFNCVFRFLIVIRIISQKTTLFTETLLPVMFLLAMTTRLKCQTLGWWDKFMKMCAAQRSLKSLLRNGWPQNHFTKAFTRPKVTCELAIPSPWQGNHAWLKRFYYCNHFSSLRKHPFLLALRHWGRFARRNVCVSATEIPYWWRKRSSYIVLAIVYEWQTKDKRPQRSNVKA